MHISSRYTHTAIDTLPWISEYLFWVSGNDLGIDDEFFDYRITIVKVCFIMLRATSGQDYHFY